MSCFESCCRSIPIVPKSSCLQQKYGEQIIESIGRGINNIPVNNRLPVGVGQRAVGHVINIFPDQFAVRQIKAMESGIGHIHRIAVKDRRIFSMQIKAVTDRAAAAEKHGRSAGPTFFDLAVQVNFFGSLEGKKVVINSYRSDVYGEEKKPRYKVLISD